MNPKAAQPSAEFDAYADAYEADLQKGLSATGEDSTYFATGRVHWLQRRLHQLNARPATVLDFGCGTGGACTALLGLTGVQRVIGVDVSQASLDVARRRINSDRIEFHPLQSRQPSGSVDLAFCNGVFHHIPRDQRAAAVAHVAAELRPGGWFAFWENNPLNPGVRYVMSRVAFDRDADPFTARTARRMLRARGLETLLTDYCFIFPRALRVLRPLEPACAKLPLGGQYLVLARKPAGA